MKQKSYIDRVAFRSRYKADYEAAERTKAWAEVKAKEKEEISRLDVEASEKTESKAEVRVTKKAYAANRAAE